MLFRARKILNPIKIDLVIFSLSKYIILYPESIIKIPKWFSLTFEVYTKYLVLFYFIYFLIAVIFLHINIIPCLMEWFWLLSSSFLSFLKMNCF